MSRAYVLMTALPPTKGHLKLIEFADLLADRVEVILCTQPDEPFTDERYVALNEAIQAISDDIHLNRIHKELPQEPEGHEGFWDMWTGFLEMFGFQPGDYIVASEAYGKTLADYCGGNFMPYDVGRELYDAKATQVRENPFCYFDRILPEFQPCIRKTVTIFGAESTGKTTLSKELALSLDCHWLFEYARPYLENKVNEITEQTMYEIWLGQRALQDQANLDLFDKPFIFQDTDLFSTVGYWELSPWALSGREKVPAQLVEDALARKSDLYLVTQANIPFEQDPLRYGGDKREISDAAWVDLCERYGLNYVVLQGSSLSDRFVEATEIALEFFDKENACLDYQRQGAEYRKVEA